MDLLRWILLIAGVVIILLIYLISRGSSSRRKWKDEEGLQDEDLSGFSSLRNHANLVHDEELNELGKGIRLQEEAAMSDEQPAVRTKDAGSHEDSLAGTEQARVPDKIIVIYLVSASGEKLSGNRIQEAMHKAGLEFGDMNIFHRFPDEGMKPGNPVFSVANLVEPGTFDLASLPYMETPGLTLFISLKARPEALKSFDLFMDTANQLKQELGAELRDQGRNVLNRQAITHLRDGVVEFCHQSRLVRAGR